MPVFKIGEFINMAIKDEETGEAFYRALAESTKNNKIKSGCNRIADQERKHAERFKKMLDEVGMTKAREDYDGQYEAYLNFLLTSRAFPKPQDAANMASKSGDAAALKIAMGLEKDSLLFYDEILELLPNTHKGYINDIIEEERVHLEDLWKLVNSLQ